MMFELTDKDFGANGWRTQESIDREERAFLREEFMRFVKDITFYVSVSALVGLVFEVMV